ncbi:MAG: 4-alpha-glucanotransferase [Chloroflexi bacterium]|nr:4-alpha-glucanotransferase [Chloroflexota bacterium]
MIFPRSSGILLHPTSLPGRYGIGDAGEWAYRFVDYLAAAGQTVWQMLPLGPTSYGDSPYQSLSAFAGNPLLISLDKLVEAGWLTTEDVAIVPGFSDERVDYGNVIPYHFEMLAKAHQNFFTKADARTRAIYSAWSQKEAHWLEDFALFMALKNSHDGRPWVEWPEGEALRHPHALDEARQRLGTEISQHHFYQWLFHTQWMNLKEYANNLGIRLIGDLPIFVAHDSSDVWANPELFYLDERGNPTVVAGVPPDYFSQTGQRWGNPHYHWDRLEKREYRWWTQRLESTLEWVDIVRIDHFRGFEAYWEIPASEETAVRGQWVKGPGIPFFEVVREKLGSLPIVAEDLGLITPEVEAIRDHFDFPGMKVLHFAWGDLSGKNPFLPHNHTKNSIVYTGTHDNNTTIGWWKEEVTEEMRHHLGVFTEREISEPHWILIRMAWGSVGHTAVAPMQDLLGLDERHRMNTPGSLGGNWAWRMKVDELENQGVRDRLRHYTTIFRRLPEAPEEPALD